MLGSTLLPAESTIEGNRDSTSEGHIDKKSDGISEKGKDGIREGTIFPTSYGAMDGKTLGPTKSNIKTLTDGNIDGDMKSDLVGKNECVKLEKPLGCTEQNSLGIIESDSEGIKEGPSLGFKDNIIDGDIL